MQTARTEAMEARLLLTGSTTEPGEYLYSLAASAYVFNSDHSRLAVDDSDIVKLTVNADGSWQHDLYFDGSDVGLRGWEEDIDAFSVRDDGSLLISTTGCVTVSGVQHSAGGDLLRFVPTSLGRHTAGSWEMFVDGGDVGISHEENIDAVAETADGRLLISTRHDAWLPGAGSVRAEDLTALTLTSTGYQTEGTWERYFDGSDVGLSGWSENLDAVSVSADGNTIQLSTLGTAWVGGLKARDEDIFTFHATSLGKRTRGTIESPLSINGSRLGIPSWNDIDAFHATNGDPNNPQPPVIDSIADQSVDEQTEFSLLPSASDADTPAADLTWSLDQGPSGASIDAVTGQVTWTPTEADGPGTFEFMLSVSDGTQSDSESFQLSVQEVNRAPELDELPNLTVTAGQTVLFDSPATDPDRPANSLVWSLSGDVPAGSSFDPATGQFSWDTTTANGGQNYDLTVTVSDGSLSDQQSLRISVTATSGGLTIDPIDDQSINELAAFSYQVIASGSGGGGPSAIDFDTDANGLPLSAGTIFAEQFAAAGVHVTTHDPVRHPPMIFDSANPTGHDYDLGTPNQQFGGPGIGNGGKSGRWKNDVARGNVLIISEDADASDPDDNGRGGKLIFTFDEPTSVDEIGLLDVDSGRNSVYLYDATGSLIRRVNIPRRGDNSHQVHELNETGVSRLEVEFDGSGAVTDLVFCRDGSCATGGGPLTYALAPGAPAGMTISDTGLIEWTPTEAQGPGTYSVTVEVSDGAATATETFSVAVGEVNQPPVIAPIADQAIDELTTLSVAVAASDADLPAQTLTYSLSGVPPTGMAIDGNGLLTWTPSEAQGPATYDITVDVSDGQLTTSTSFSVSVREVNQAPEITPIPDVAFNELSEFTMQVEATDADLPANHLAFELLGSVPGGLSIDGNGLISWTPTEAQGPATYPITVQVSDGSLATTDSFDITVNEVNQDPMLATIGDQTVTAGESLSFTASATDFDLPANTLTYAISGDVPSGATFDSSTGQFLWNSDPTDGPATLNVTITVEDGAGGSDSESFTITVAEPAVATITLTEDDRFETTASQSIIIPAAASYFEFEILNLSFDTDASSRMSDAFEVALLDADGRPLVHPISTNRDSFYNVSERGAAAAGVNTQIDGNFVRVDLSHVPAGTAATVVYRLVNNDNTAGNDTETTVRVTEGTVVTGDLNTSAGRTIEAATATAAVDLTGLIDVTSSFDFEYRQTSFDDATDVLFAGLQLTNESNQPIDGPFVLVIQNLSDPSVTAKDSDGTTADGSPDYLLQDSDGDGTLQPGESTAVRTLQFINPDETPFDYTVTLLAEPNDAPEFVSSPVTLVEAGRPYRYDARAEDPDGDELTYELAIGPDGMSIDPASGQITWQPEAADQGNHSVRLLVTDGRGASDEQSFTVEVRDVVPNRPPVIVSSPVTEVVLPAVRPKVVGVWNQFRADAWSLVDGEFSDNYRADLAATFSNAVVVGTSALTEDFLAQIDILIIGASTGNSIPIKPLTAAEQTALYDFVAGGGSALLMPENNFQFETASNSFLAPFGLASGGFNQNEFRVSVTDPDHPIFSGDYGTITGYDLWYPGEITTLGPNAVPIAEIAPGRPVAAVIEPGTLNVGSGAVVVLVNQVTMGDDDIPGLPNVFPLDSEEQILHRNIISYLGGSDIAEASPATYQYDVNAIDADADVLTYTLLEGPGGMQIDPATGKITWIPSLGQSETRAGDATITNYTQLDISEFTNIRIQNNGNWNTQSYQGGPLNVEGVPFNLPVEGNSSWLSHFDSTGTVYSAAQSVLEMDVNIFGATEVHSLINSLYGETGPGVLAHIEFIGSDGAFYRFDLDGNDDIRDFNQNSFTNEINGITTVNAISFNNSSDRLDKVKVTLPEEFATQTLTQIRFVDNGADRRQLMFVSGVTVATERPIGESNHVKVRVDDGRGGTAIQEYDLAILADPTNTAPVIVTEPVDDFFIPGFSNPASGQVTPQRISLDLGNGETFDGTVSITLPDQAGRFADIVISVDESLSMGGDQDWIPDMIPLLDQALKDAGIGATTENPNRFAIVGGGRQNLVSYFFSQQPNTNYTLYGPDNEVVAEGAIDEVLPDELLNLQFKDDGRYILIVEAADPTDLAAGIEIGLEGDVGEAVRVEPLPLNTLVSEEFLLPGQPVQYQFSLSTDTLLYFDSQTKDDYSFIHWSLEGPTGTLASEIRLQNSDTADLTPTYSAVAGDYTLTIDALYDTASDFKFQLLDLKAGTPLNSGEFVADEFNTRVDTKAYQFNAAQGQLFSFQNSTPAVHPGSRWRLVSSSGEVLLSKTMGTNQSPMELPYDGQYFLLMEAALWPLEGTAQLRQPSTFEFTAEFVNAAPPTPINFGDTVNGTIDFVEDFVRYSFSLAERSRLYLDALTDNSMTWQLTGPAGTTSATRFTATDSFNNADPVLDLFAGDYTLRIDSNGNEGPFAFRLLDLSDAPSITPGTSFSGELSVPNQTDVYKFNASADDRFFVDIVAASDSGNSLYRIYDQYGRQLEEVRSLSDLPEFVSPADGDYTLLVEGWRANVDQDTYSINIVPIAESTQPLTLGTRIDGTLTTPGERAEYTFNLPSDTQLYFDSLTNNPNIVWSLQGPRGQEVSSLRFDRSDSVDRIDASIDARAGDWTLTVHGNADSIGSFSFVLLNLLDNSHTTPITPNPGSANPNVTITPSPGRAANQTEVFRLNANSGDEFSFVTTVGGSVQSYYRLLDQNGTEVVPRTFLTNDQLNETLTLGGTYYLLVEGRYSDTDVDDWSIDINFEQNNGATSYSGTPLNLGTTTSGNLSSGGQVDAYTFTLSDRSVAYFDSLTDSSSVRWNLTGPAGQIVSNRSFSASDAFNLTDVGIDLLAGDYLLEVFAGSGTPGAYSFRLHDVATAASITPGTAFSNTIDPANETHLYQFDANAGDVLYFRVEAASDVNNTLYKLLDPFGRRIFTSNDLRDFGPLTIDFTGSHTLLVEAWRANTGVDTYTINVQPVPAATQTSLVFGDVNTGSLTTPGETAQFTFSLNDYTQVHFDSLTDSSNYRWTLTNSVGTVVDERRFDLSDSTNGTVNVIELTPDDYTLTVSGIDDSQPFAFRLLDVATNSTAISTDTPVTSTHVNSRSTNIFDFDLTDGDRVFFESVATSGFSTTGRWRLFDVFGNEVFDTATTLDVGPLTVERTGNYRLIVEGSYRDTGSNGQLQFEVVSLGNEQRPTAPTALTLGQVISSDIAKRFEIDRYAFSLAEPTLGYFDSLTNDNNLNWTLRNEDRTFVANRTFNSGLSSLVPLPAGNYELSITASETRAYSFAFLNLATASVIVPGTPAAGQLTTGNETDVYRFTGSAGDEVYLDVVSVESANRATVSIVNERGEVLTSSTNLVDQDTITLPADGQYFVLIEGKTNQTASTDYEINVVPTGTVQQPLTLGATQTDAVNTIGQSVRYSFNLPQSTSLYFDSLTDTGSIEWNLIGPAGSVVSGRRFNASDSFNNATPVLSSLSPGDYTLTVTGSGDAVGNFSFRLVDLAAATPITIGVPVSGELTIPNETDFYQFEGTFGDSLLIDWLAADDTDNSLYRIFDPFGTEVFELRDLVDGEVPTLPFSGTFTLLVEGWRANTGLDTYQFNVVKSANRTVPINVGDTVAENLSIGEEVAFTFDAASDMFLHFDSLTNRADLAWSLSGPTGQVVSDRAMTRSDSVDFTDSVFELRAGRYRLTVDGATDFTGDFGFRLTDVSTAPAITPGTLTGALDPGNESLLYRLNATAGDDFSFESVSAGNGNAYYRLVDPFGRTVFTRAITGDQDNVLLDTTGTYTLLVEGRITATAANPFELNIVFNGNTTPPALTGSALVLGATQSGDLTAGGQVDSYQFSLSDRSLLHMDVLTNSSSFRWTLQGPRGIEVQNRSFTSTDSIDSSTSNLDLPAGDYQLDIFASSGTPGDYEFTLHNFADAISIAPGTEVSGELTNPAETDLYQFTAIEGDRFLIDIVSTNDVNNKEFKLIDQYGIVVATSNGLRDVDQIAAPNDGTYTLLVEGRRSNTGIDTYTLNVVPVESSTLTLTPGSSSNTTLPIGGEQQYTFSLSDSTLLLFTPQTDSNQLKWTLSSADGTFVNSRGFNDGTLPIDLPAGSYVLAVDGTDDYTGDAAFTVVTADLSSQLAFDQTTNTRLTTSSSVAVYQFQGIAGQHFALRPDFNLAFDDAATSAATADALSTAYDNEDQHSGIDVALRNDVFRTGAAINFITVSDEDRDVLDDNVNFETIFRDLSARGALLNAIVSSPFRDGNNAVAIGVDSEGNAYLADGSGGFTVSPGGIATTGNISIKQDYIDLAWALDGAAWDLGRLRVGGVTAESFTNAFVDVKVAEILEQTALRLSASDPNADLTLINPADGTYDAISGGQTYDFDIQIGNDGNPRSFDLLFTQGQTVGSIPVYIVAPYGYNARAVDADGDTLTWSITEGPDGLVVDPATGILTWPADFVVYGVHPVTLRVADGRGGFDEQTFDLNVNGGEAASISGRVQENLSPSFLATTVAATVPGSANPYLAGMPDGATASGGDTAPAQSPVEVLGIDWFEGGMLTFTATGQVSRTGGTPNPSESPDGALSGSGAHAAGAQNGISNITSNYGSLIGVFLSDAQPNESAAPAPLDFVNGSPGGPLDNLVRPSLQQPFFIGDGLNAIGIRQEFVVPEGATRLFLATADSSNWSDNTGSFEVQITQTVGHAHVLDEMVFDGKTYQLLAGNAEGLGINWNDAQVYAARNGGSLAIVNDAALDAAIYNEWGNDSNVGGLWIGLTDRADEGVFVWESTSELPSYTNWSPGEPNQFQGNNEDAVIIWGSGNLFGGTPSRWNDAPRTALGNGASDIYAVVEVGRRLTETRTVFIDQNRNGLLDTDEPSQQTDIDGYYAFPNLAAGTYTVSQLPLAGWEQTAPTTPYEIALQQGEDRVGVDFVNQPVPITNSDPLIQSTPVLSVTARETYRYQPVVDEFDGDVLTFDLPLAPAGMAVNEANGTISWTPQLDQIGSQNVLLRVRDGRGGFDLQFFNVEVQKPNTAPVITSTPPAGPAGVNLPFTYDVDAADAENDALTWSLTAAPNGATIDSASGVLNWTPAPNQLGTQSFEVTVDDGRGLTTSQSFNIEVQIDPANTEPSITSQPPLAVWLGDRYTYLVQANDPNGDPLGVSLDSAPAGMTIDADGVVTWQPTPAQLGSHTVRVLSDDGRGGVAVQEFTLTVETQPVNLPPSITSPPLTFAVAEQPYRFSPTATDPNADALLWSLEDGPIGMSIDANTGRIDWTPTTADIGEHAVTVQVIDPLAAFSQLTYTLRVNAVNTPPVILSTPPTSGAVGATYLYQVAANDADQDTLTFSLTQAPTGMTINPQTGRIQWTPATGQDGNADVGVTVADSLGATITQNFRIAVADGQPNQLPVITSTPSFFTSVNDSYSYDVAATDADGDTLTYALLQSPSGMTIDAATGLIEWTPTAGDLGTTLIEILVTDPSGGGSLQSYSLTVLAANNAPEITSTPPSSVAAGSAFRYDLVATDADGEFLTYELIDAPAGMLIDGVGRMFWIPTDAQVGDSDVEVRVSDPRGGTDTQSFTITVEADTTAPQVAVLLSANPVDVGAFVDVRVSAVDNVGIDSLLLTIDGQPVPLNANGSARIATSVTGTLTVVATATDAAGNSTSEQTTIFVADPNDVEGPVLSITSPSDGGIVTALTDVVGTVNDDTLVEYRLLLAEFGSSDFRQIASGNANVADGVLGQIDPTLISSGSYVLRLEAEDAGGRSNAVQQLVEIVGENKLGNFRLSFTDLVVPVSGIDVVLSRTYDSLDSSDRGDFGFGWTMDFRDVQLQVSVPEVDARSASLGLYSPYRDGTRIYITPPGGRREAFTFAPVAKGVLGLVYYTPRFIADDGVTSTLTVSNANLNNSFGEYYAFSGGQPYNPAAFEFGGGFTLTTEEGLAYRINAATGQVTSISDPNGNRLNFSDAGVTSNSGVSVTFERDIVGRITAAVDPAGQRLQYSYDVNGDLETFTDRDGHVSRYEYDAVRPHFLTDVIDPLGNTGIRGEYDSEGRLISLTDADGNSLSITTNVSSNTQVVVDEVGSQTIYQYDSRGNTTAETNALGDTTASTFDTDNNLLTETDPLGRVTRYTYDSFGNVLTITDPAGAVTMYTYANARRGLVASITDPLGNTTTYTYDSKGNLTSFDDGSGVQAGSTYDSKGNLTAYDDPVSGRTTYTYDAAGNLLTSTNADGTVTSFTYDANGRTTSQTWTQTINGTEQTLTESYQYDGNGNLTQQTDALGNISSFDYDAAGRLITETDALGRTTRFVYDDRGLLTETIYPDATPVNLSDNPRTLNAYDELGRSVSQTDELGRTSYIQYDAIGQVIAEIFPDNTPSDLTDNPRVLSEYDAAGQVTAVVDENGNRTEFEYDSAGNRILTRDALGNETTFEFDSQGRQIRTTDALGQETQFSYDDAGRITRTTFADNTTTQIVYDNNGLISARIDQKGNTTSFGYDSLGQLTEVTESNGAITRYGYDELGNLTSLTDAEGRTTIYAYDALNRRISVERPLGESDLAEFDAVGNRIAYTDFNGDRHTFAYDERDRLITKNIVGDPTVTYTYLANSLPTTIVDGRGTTSYMYDERDRLRTQTDPDGSVLSYSYDDAGNTTDVTTLAGTTNYTFDAVNRVSTVTDVDAAVTSFAYDAVGRPVETTFANGVIETRTYDVVNRLVQIESSLSGTVFDRLAYTFDAKGNRLSVTELDGRSVEYTYDSVDRLLSETVFEAGSSSADRTTSFTYDAVSNRLTRIDTTDGLTTYTYDANDRLVHEVNVGTTTTYGYDLNGNRVSKSDGTTTTLYDYSGENRLLSFDADGDGTAEVSYLYDADGNRVSRSEAGTTVFYQVDSNRALAQTLTEYATGGTVIASHTLVGNQRISQHRAAGPAFYHADSLGSTRLLTDASGAVLNTYTYDAFGSIVNETGTYENEFLFDGQRRDATTGLDYLRARYYDSTTGRFTGVDPFDGVVNSPVTLHNYLYAGANPVNASDPTGRFTIAEISVTTSTIADVQKSFQKNAFEGLKRVGRIADKLLVPGTLMQNVGAALMTSNSARSLRAYEIYSIGTQLRAAGFQAIGVALAGIYVDTVNDVGSVGISWGKDSKLGKIFGPVELKLKLLNAKLTVGKGKNKKTVEAGPNIENLIKKYITDSENLLKANNLGRYIQKGDGNFEKGLKQSIQLAQRIEKQIGKIVK
ncbi:MAG: hypothetical protein Fues2KO_40470 [Fuerstiella sp.]